MNRLPEIKLATLENFYENVHDPLSQGLFTGLLELRELGYGPDYPERFLPLDTTDFVARHHLFCIEQEGRLTPIAGGTHCSLRCCDDHHLLLPIVELARSSGSPAHAQAIEALVEDFRSRDAELINGLRMTIVKRFRQEPFSSLVKELVAALLAHEFRHQDVRGVVTDAILRFKTDRLFTKIGFEPMSFDGLPLPALIKASAGGEPALLMSAESMSPWAEDCLKRHEGILESRLWIRRESKKAA